MSEIGRQPESQNFHRQMHAIETYGAEEGGKQTLGRLAEYVGTLAE